MPHGFLSFLTLGTLAFSTAFAALDYDSYRVVDARKTVRDGDGNDSTYTLRTYELTRLGPVSLEASKLDVTSHGSYLAIVEEATLVGNLDSKPHDITQDFLFQGTLPIPALAAVHELSVWHGDTVFQGHLKKSIYSWNDSFFDTTALAYTLDHRVAFLQRLNETVYEVTFTRLALGEPIRVRVAYDLPMSGAPGATLQVPLLFAPSGKAPRQVQIHFTEMAEDLPALQWLNAQGRITLDHQGTHTVEYQASYTFRRDEKVSTVVTLQSSEFASGSLRGDYLLFKGGLNDSLMTLLSRPLEVTFFWRWNPPYALVEMRDGLKTLSGMGQMAVLQAKAMKQVIEELGPRGHRFGLFHSQPGRPDVEFKPAPAGSDETKALIHYLDGFQEQALYEAYKNYRDTSVDWATETWQDSSAFFKTQQNFFATLKHLREGFGSSGESLRHIEMIGLGPVKTTAFDWTDPATTEEALGEVTMASVWGAWPGIAMEATLKAKANENLRAVSLEAPAALQLPPLFFPVFQPTSVEYRAFTAAGSHAVILPFHIRAEREAVIKGGTPFSDTVQLQGIDALGRKTRILTLNPRRLKQADDSGLARLWAADPDRIAEQSEVELGMRYGILTLGTYWTASVSDGILSEVLPPGSNSSPILPKSFSISRTAIFSLQGNALRISANALGPVNSGFLEVYDLRGKLLVRLDLRPFRRGNGYWIPLAELRLLGWRQCLLVLRGQGRMHSFPLALGVRS